MKQAYQIEISQIRSFFYQKSGVYQEIFFNDSGVKSKDFFI
jgi:hypothetical protein